MSVLPRDNSSDLFDANPCFTGHHRTPFARPSPTHPSRCHPADMLARLSARPTLAGVREGSRGSSAAKPPVYAPITPAPRRWCQKARVNRIDLGHKPAQPSRPTDDRSSRKVAPTVRLFWTMTHLARPGQFRLTAGPPLPLHTPNPSCRCFCSLQSGTTRVNSRQNARL